MAAVSTVRSYFIMLLYVINLASLEQRHVPSQKQLVMGMVFESPMTSVISSLASTPPRIIGESPKLHWSPLVVTV